MLKLLTVQEMQAIEKEADQNGVSFAEMIERAGQGIAQWIQDEYEDGTLLGLIGTGNNGGDALVALETLAKKGWTCRGFLPRERAGDDPLIVRARQAGVEFVSGDNKKAFEQFDSWLQDTTLIIDGLLGTGAQLPLKPAIENLLTHISNHTPLPDIIAIDCPSGVDCTTGDAAPQTLKADATLCIEAIKTGLLKLPAFKYVGSLIVIPLHLPAALLSWPKTKRIVISDLMAQNLLPARRDDAYKGSFGTALIVAGSINYSGAAYLAAKAACRIGAGLVRLAVPGPLHIALAGSLPDVTWLILPHEMGVIAAEASDILKNNIHKANALLLGPGWGQEVTTAEFLLRLLENGQRAAPRRGIGFVILDDEDDISSRQPLPPMVIDADGLKLLSHIPEWQNLLPPDTILTPHPGEMSVLTGMTIEDIQADRIGAAQKYAQEWQHVVVLKGAFTVVASPNGDVSVLPIATAALSHAGTGDVLSGIIVGLLAQGLPAVDAAIAGVWVHGQAGLSVANQMGHTTSVLASDVLEAIPDVL